MTVYSVRFALFYFCSLSDILCTGHTWVFQYARIIHRDISFGNLMVSTVNGRTYGVLNDFDLATYVDQVGHPTSNHRTGTRCAYLIIVYSFTNVIPGLLSLLIFDVDNCAYPFRLRPPSLLPLSSF